MATTRFEEAFGELAQVMSEMGKLPEEDFAKEMEAFVEHATKETAESLQFISRAFERLWRIIMEDKIETAFKSATSEQGLDIEKLSSSLEELGMDAVAVMLISNALHLGDEGKRE